ALPHVLCHLDAAASTPLSHVCQAVFTRPVPRPAFPRHHPVPLPLGESLKADRLAIGATGAADARIVHQHVQRAEAGHGSSNGLLPVLGFRHIQLDEEARAAAGVDLGLYLLAFLCQEIPNDHLGTLTGKEPDFCSTLAPGTAANERHLAF